MSNRILIGLLAVGFALSAAEGCQHDNAKGTGGTTGTGNGSGQAGTGSGSAGTTGTAGTTGAGGTVSANEMIDNLDDNNAFIIMANGRQGPWHSFNDSNGGNIQPPLGTGFVATAGGANNTAYAVHTTGSGYQFGGVGFDL